MHKNSVAQQQQQQPMLSTSINAMYSNVCRLGTLHFPR